MHAAPHPMLHRYRLPQLVTACLLFGALPQASAAETCAYPEFDAFFNAFSADAALQQDASADPLPMSWIDMEADPEPAKVNRDIPHAEMNWPVIFDFNAPDQGVTTQIAAPDDKNRVVFVSGNDNGVSEIYYFRAEPCWTLVRVDSNST